MKYQHKHALQRSEKNPPLYLICQRNTAKTQQEKHLICILNTTNKITVNNTHHVELHLTQSPSVSWDSQRQQNSHGRSC